MWADMWPRSRPKPVVRTFGREFPGRTDAGRCDLGLRIGRRVWRTLSATLEIPQNIRNGCERRSEREDIADRTLEQIFLCVEQPGSKRHTDCDEAEFQDTPGAVFPLHLPLGDLALVLSLENKKAKGLIDDPEHRLVGYQSLAPELPYGTVVF